MTVDISTYQVALEDLRWRLDLSKLPFETTDELKPLTDIIGQERGVDAFRFGMGMNKTGYNVFVTGAPGSGRLTTVTKLLKEISAREKAPDDLCYVNNFKDSEAPILLVFKAGQGELFRKDVQEFIDTLKREVPQIFESPEYVARKGELIEAHEKKTREFFKSLEEKVKESGFALVQIQSGGGSRPELMPMVDEKPLPMLELEDMVNKGRYPKDEFAALQEKYGSLKKEIDQIFLEIRELQRKLKEKGRDMDKVMFRTTAKERLDPLLEKYPGKPAEYLTAMLEDMAQNLEIFSPQTPPQGLPPGFMVAKGDQFQPYQVNVLVDNTEQKSPPLIIESYPTYRNLFGSIERVVDRSGVWRTDFSKIKAGSFLKANGGYLVINLMDALTEPGVWPALKRALKTSSMEIQTFDPMYWFTSTGLKPEPIDIDVKVVVLSDTRIYSMLRYYDEDVPKIFKVRADFDTSMEKTDESVIQFSEFMRSTTQEQNLLPLDRSGLAAMVEHAVRMAGRREKLSTRFPELTDLLCEADFRAREDKASVITEEHVKRALDARIYRSNLVEEKIQEMIDRGSIFIDTDGAEPGQINGLAVYGLGDYSFGKPSRITASISMGKEGVINIEREADLSGSIHNKGVLILGGFLRRMFAQDKPLAMSASIAFEQSYGGVDGDSASSTEIYALLSSIADIPLRQDVAVTGSVNQKGQVQPIGGVNEKIEGFYSCCRHGGLTGKQGVMIPKANVKDLMLKDEVVQAVKDGKFHVWAVETIEQGLEILTGMAAGQRGDDKLYPADSVYGMVDAKLRELAEGLVAFGKSGKDDE